MKEVRTISSVPAAPGAWEGGPVDARFADLGGDAHLDAVALVVFDQIGGPGVEVHLATFSGAGTGDLTPSGSVVVPWDGTMDVADMDGDGVDDVVVSQRRGPGVPHDVHVYTGNGSGKLDPVPTILTPATAYACLAGWIWPTWTTTATSTWSRRMGRTSRRA